jgi:hypothetical protein
VLFVTDYSHACTSVRNPYQDLGGYCEVDIFDTILHDSRLDSQEYAQHNKKEHTGQYRSEKEYQCISGVWVHIRISLIKRPGYVPKHKDEIVNENR